jgi:hypothetical protein
LSGNKARDKERQAVRGAYRRNGGPPKEAAVWFGLPAESDGLIRESR